MWGIAIALLLIAAAAMWYYLVPMQQARWRAAHETVMGYIREAAEGRPSPAAVPQSAEFPAEVRKSYEEGLTLAIARREATERWKKQSAETAKVIDVAATVLADGNQIGLDALRGRIKEVLQGQKQVDKELDDSAAATSEWQSRFRQTWETVWPGNGLDSSVMTEAHAVDFDFAGTAVADNTLRQIEGDEQKLIASLSTGVEEASLSPYAKDKLAAARARYELAHRMHMALDDATMALSLEAPQSAGGPRVPGEKATY
jgi:hypothetical protein